jgi:hypothetical protein
MMRALSASLASSSDASSTSALTWSLVVKATVLARESLSSALCASTATSCSGNVANILPDCQKITSLDMTGGRLRTHESPISVRFPFFPSGIVLIHLPPKITWPVMPLSVLSTRSVQFAAMKGGWERRNSCCRSAMMRSGIRRRRSIGKIC